MFNFLKNQTHRSKSNHLKNREVRPSNDSASMFRRHKPDYVILLVAVGLLITGLIVVYSISPALAAGSGGSGISYVIKQLVSILLGLLAFAVFSSLPIEVLKRNNKILIWASLIMVIMVQVFGEKVNGAYRWIQVGGISFQVAELIKFTIITWLAWFLVQKMNQGVIKSNDKTLKPLVYLLALIGFVVVGLESDFGSAAVITASVGLMAFSAGLPIKRIAMIGGVIALGLFFAVASTPYRRERVHTFLNPSSDCQDAGYQSCQALIAVGSGGIFGLGLANGVQAYGYLPEAENDSIFAIISEKFGFIGASLVVVMYGLLFSRMHRIIKRCRDPYSRLFVTGVLAWMSIQTIINVGAMIGLLPLKGITLPLISYGGTSLVFVLAALGVVFQISRFTTYSSVSNVNLAEGEGGTNENTISRGRQRRPYYAASSHR